jgi:alpha-glucoside transport system substrate-binding protein
MALPRRTLRTVALAGVFTFTLAACGGGDDGGETGAAAGGGDVDCADYEQYGDLEGQTVSVYTGIVTPEDQPHIDSWKPFEECTGATIEGEFDKAFETQILVRAQAGNPPDIAYVPQPGPAAQLVGTGRPSRPRGHGRERRRVLGRGLEGLRHRRRQFYAAPLGANMKSLVWYSPAEFEEAATRSRRRWTSSRSSPTRSPSRARSPGAPASPAARPPAGRSPTGTRT